MNQGRKETNKHRADKRTICRTRRKICPDRSDPDPVPLTGRCQSEESLLNTSRDFFAFYFHNEALRQCLDERKLFTNKQLHTAIASSNHQLENRNWLSSKRIATACRPESNLAHRGKAFSWSVRSRSGSGDGTGSARRVSLTSQHNILPLTVII